VSREIGIFEAEVGAIELQVLGDHLGASELKSHRGSLVTPDLRGNFSEGLPTCSYQLSVRDS
jgi:hypothetical protein